MTVYTQQLSEQQALDILKPYREAINQAIPRLLLEYVGDSRFLPLLEEHFGVTGYEATVSHSKRLRGALCMMVAESLGISLDRIKSFACSLEFFHAASLIIDDIQDNSTERVGNKAIWTQIGKNRAIDAGFYLKDTGHRVFHKDISLFLAASHNLNDHIHEVSQEIATGQDMDLCASSQWRFGFSRYQEIASRKTGRLIGLSLCLPFLLVGRDEESRILSEFGNTLGVVHQLNDDIDDLAKTLSYSPDERPLSLDPGNVAFFLDASLGADNPFASDHEPIPFCPNNCHELISRIQNTIDHAAKELLDLATRLPLPRGTPFENILLLCTFLAERNAPILKQIGVTQGGER